eukprot:Rmarinus@m.14256
MWWVWVLISALSSAAANGVGSGSGSGSGSGDPCPGYDYLESLSDEATLCWIYDDDSISISLEIEGEHGWIGMGIADPEIADGVNKMTNADIVTGQWTETAGSGDVVVSDRWAVGPGTPSDDEPQDWTLEHFGWNGGTTMLRASRALATGDTADRDFVAGDMLLLFAYGSLSSGSISYHQGNRGFATVELIVDGGRVACSEEYDSFTAVSESITFCYSYNDDDDSVSVALEVTGEFEWAGFGLVHPEIADGVNLMTGADIATGQLSGESGALLDRMATSTSRPSSDEPQDWVLEYFGWDEGVTVVRGSRALDTGDAEHDHVIVSGPMQMIFAYGMLADDDDVSYHGSTQRTTASITFFEEDRPSCADDFDHFQALDAAATLCWSTTEETISLELQVMAEAEYVGFGLADPNLADGTNAMTQADIATGQVAENEDGFEIVDRWATGPSKPGPDAQQDWAITSFTVADGTTSLRASRALDTGDEFDWPIVSGATLVLYAYGSLSGGDISYHTSRNKVSVALIGEGQECSVDCEDVMREACDLSTGLCGPCLPGYVATSAEPDSMCQEEEEIDNSAAKAAVSLAFSVSDAYDAYTDEELADILTLDIAAALMVPANRIVVTDFLREVATRRLLAASIATVVEILSSTDETAPTPAQLATELEAQVADENSLFYTGVLTSSVEASSVVIEWEEVAPSQSASFDGGNYVIEWTITGQTIQITLDVATSAWAGFSISPNSAMARSDFVVGWLSSGGDGLLYDRYLNSDSQGQPSVDESLGGTHDVSLLEASTADGRLRVVFTRALDTGDVYDHPIVEGETTKMLWAYGDSASDDGSFTGHPFGSQRGAGNINFFTGEAEEISIDLPEEIRAHGILMGIAWLGFLPAGALCGAYAKGILTTGESGAVDPWFHLHRFFQMTGLLLMTIGFFIILDYNDWEMKDDDPHYNIGLSVVILALLQGVNGLLRLPKDHEHRLIWRCSHALLGVTSLCLAAYNVWLGFDLIDITDSNEGLFTAWFIIIITLFVWREYCRFDYNHNPSNMGKSDWIGFQARYGNMLMMVLIVLVLALGCCGIVDEALITGEGSRTAAYVVISIGSAGVLAYMLMAHSAAPGPLESSRESMMAERASSSAV